MALDTGSAVDVVSHPRADEHGEKGYMQGVVLSRAPVAESAQEGESATDGTAAGSKVFMVAMEDGEILKAPQNFLKVVLPAEKNKEV